MKIENIKFKAKALNSGKWVVGDLLHRITDTCIAVKDMDDIVYYPVDPATVCQFTGLKDCKGEEIFEHDLIHFVGYEPTAEVIWSEDDYAFMTTSDMNLFLLSDVIDVGNGKIEVVGNKFDKESNYGKIQSR